MNESWNIVLSRYGARFIDGRVAHYGEPTKAVIAEDSETVLCDLSHEGLILVGGDDAAAFLHAQLCNDVLALADDHAQWNGWCSPKGRLLTTFLLWPGKQGFFIALPRALRAAIQKRLQMFVLRSKVTLEDASDTWIHFGVAGPGAEAAVRRAMGDAPTAPMTSIHTAEGRAIRLSPSRFIVIANPVRAPDLWALCAQTSVMAGAATWDLRAIREGILVVQPETQDAFVPQMANFELVGGVSFKKGCYPGQEIVARTQYRGILKRRMARVEGDSESPPKAGDSVFAAEFGDQAAGTVAQIVSTSAGHFEALVVAQMESLKNDSLRIGGPDGAHLKRLTLPYPLPD
jgi:folate-binding protein YgfZ